MIPQLISNSIVAGGEIALVAISFTFIYSVTRFFNFAHSASYVAGAYAGYSLIVLAGCSPTIGFFGAVAAGAFVGMVLEFSFFGKLRDRQASSLVLLLVSFGLMVVFQNLISIMFGDATLVLRRAPVSRVFQFADARITSIQAAVVLTSLGVGVSMEVLLWFTRMGRVFRAIASDPELALVRGVPVDGAILVIFGIGSGMAGLAGILVAYDTDLYPTMGMHALLLGIVAAIVGGIDSVAGAAVGAMLLGFAQQFGVWKLPTGWQDAIAFSILIFFLLVRPQGFLGEFFKRTA